MLRRSFIVALTAGTLLVVSGVGSLASAAAPSMAAGSAEVKLDVIHATKAGGVDEALAPLRRTLLKAFKGYGGFSRLDGQRVTVAKGAAKTLALPNHSRLEYRFVGVDVDGYLQMAIKVGGLSSTVKVRDGGIFFQAGRGYKGGMIVLAFKVKLQR